MSFNYTYIVTEKESCRSNPGIGEKDIHMQVMVEASDIGLKKIIRSHTEAMEMVQPWECQLQAGFMIQLKEQER